jgi:hypothetical protein
MTRNVGTLAASAVVAATATAALSLLAPAAMAAGSGVPFTDPNVHGYVALCDLSGNNVTSGSVASAPFVWKAVSSTAAPAGYAGKGQNTALTIYQPRKGVDPGEWNGDQLTGASFYQKGHPPAAAATYKDISLATIVREFPPTWDGLYQLRMIVARKGYGDYTQTYPATVIQVTGATWHVVQGGTASCNQAHTTSSETFAGIPVTNPKSTRLQTPASAPDPQRATTVAGGSTPNGSAAAAPTAHVISASLRSDSSPAPKGSDTTAITLGAAAVVVIAGLASGVFWRRRQRPFVNPLREDRLSS